MSVANEVESVLAQAAGFNTILHDPLVKQVNDLNANSQSKLYYIDHKSNSIKTKSTIGLTAETASYHDLTIRGGYGYSIGYNIKNYTLQSLFGSDFYPISRCSLGFNGYSNIYGSTLQSVGLTAGHCTKPSETFGEFLKNHYSDLYSLVESLDPDSLGNVQSIRYFSQSEPLYNKKPANYLATTSTAIFDSKYGANSNNSDAGVVGHSNIWTPEPSVITYGEDGQSSPEDESKKVAVYDTVTPIAGQVVCKSGATSGWTCGEVLYDSYTTAIGDNDGSTYMLDSFMTDVCSKPGDSGGAVVSGNYALGSLSGGTSGDLKTSCVGNNDDIMVSFPFESSDTRKSDWSKVLPDSSIQIKVGKPKITSQAHKNSYLPGPIVIEGTIDAGIGTDVYIFAGSNVIGRGIVGANNEWTATITLEHGEYSLSARAFNHPSGHTNRVISSENSDPIRIVVDKNALPTIGYTIGDTSFTYNGETQFVGFTSLSPSTATISLCSDDSFLECYKILNNYFYKMSMPSESATAFVRLSNEGHQDLTLIVPMTMYKAPGFYYDAPMTLEKSSSHIKLEPVTPTTGQSVKYGIGTSCSTASMKWQTDTNFTDLEPSTVYYLLEKFLESDTHNVSFTTDCRVAKTKAPEPQVNINPDEPLIPEPTPEPSASDTAPDSSTDSVVPVNPPAQDSSSSSTPKPAPKPKPVVVPKPKTPIISKLTPKKKALVVKIKTVPNVTSYQIQYRKKGTTKWKLITISNSTTTKTIKKLARFKRYQVQIRSVLVKNSRFYYSDFSKYYTSSKIR